jgi:NAD-dependent deacetylase
MTEKRFPRSIEKLVAFIADSQRVVVFTGAGISTESGIPDFRGPDGLWTKVDPEDFTYQKFVGDREARKRIWRMHENTGFRFDDVDPNRAHRAVAALERLGKLDCIITQNVDGLHQKAGNSEERVLELHGNMQWVKCIRCGVRHPSSEVRGWTEAGVEVPECQGCGGILKPDAVFFGEAMPQRVTAEAQRRAVACDLCIVIGSTLTVYPAALMPEYAVRSGATLVIINEGRTELDHLAHLRIDAKAGETMSRALTLLEQRLGVPS